MHLVRRMKLCRSSGYIHCWGSINYFLTKGSHPFTWMLILDAAPALACMSMPLTFLVLNISPMYHGTEMVMSRSLQMIMLSPLKRWGEGIAVNQNTKEKQFLSFRTKVKRKNDAMSQWWHKGASSSSTELYPNYHGWRAGLGELLWSSWQNCKFTTCPGCGVGILSWCLYSKAATPHCCGITHVRAVPRKVSSESLLIQFCCWVGGQTRKYEGNSCCRCFQHNLDYLLLINRLNTGKGWEATGNLN